MNITLKLGIEMHSRGHTGFGEKKEVIWYYRSKGGDKPRYWSLTEEEDMARCKKKEEAESLVFMGLLNGNI